MAIVSRLELDHPALGTVGGSALHTSVENLYIKIGDNMNSRFLTETNVANAAFVEFDHNFNMDFEDMRVILYTVSGGDLTEVTYDTTPDLDDFVIEASPTGGQEKTHVRITNNSGVAQDIALAMFMGATEIIPRYKTLTATDTSVSGQHILANTSGGVFTVHLPASPALNETVWIYDIGNSFDSNNLTVGRNGSVIESAAADFTLNVLGTRAQFIFVGGAIGWKFFS